MPQTKQTPDSQTEKNVATGCLATGSGHGMISTSPLGSCVAVVAYDKTSKTGGIAHIMLPGKSPKESKLEENKYAENAIANLLMELKLLGAAKTSIEICLVGGANVLRKENDTIAKNVVSCIFETLEKINIMIKETSLGGYERRTAKLCVHSGIVTFTIGDKNEEELYNFIAGDTGGISYEKKYQ